MVAARCRRFLCSSCPGRSRVEERNMKTNKRNSEQGVALLMVLMIVILLTAIGAALIFMSNVESTVNLNYRAEQQAYYAARAGVEEVRDRMKLGPPFQAGADPVYANVPTV